MTLPHTPIAIIGAGPIGIELAIALKKADLPYLQFDKGQIAQTISHFPPQMQFFSSSDRIAIAGIPIHTTDQSKCTKEQYLAYLRTIVEQFQLDIRTYQPVTAIHPPASSHPGCFLLDTETSAGPQSWTADAVILATGDTHMPNPLNIPGEDLPHVSHCFTDPHKYFHRRLLVIGGKNSAVESALRAQHAGACVTLCYRGPEFNRNSVKYWLLPELMNRIRIGQIDCYFRSQPVRISPTSVTIENLDDHSTREIPADFVLPQIGYLADMTLFQQAGVTLTGPNQVPQFDPKTMQTDIPNLYVAGTATAGSQQSYTVFLENCHIHVKRILAHLTGQNPPDPPQANAQLET